MWGPGQNSKNDLLLCFSGLDSVSANQVLVTLKDLSNSGRTIICTIHQASASQLKIFDMLYVLTPSGHCIYHGMTSNLLDYLAVQGLRCPLYHNTADYSQYNFN